MMLILLMFVILPRGNLFFLYYCVRILNHSMNSCAFLCLYYIGRGKGIISIFEFIVGFLPLILSCIKGVAYAYMCSDLFMSSTVMLQLIKRFLLTQVLKALVFVQPKVLDIFSLCPLLQYQCA